MGVAAMACPFGWKSHEPGRQASGLVVQGASGHLTLKDPPSADVLKIDFLVGL